MSIRDIAIGFGVVAAASAASASCAIIADLDNDYEEDRGAGEALR
jgi:hypothetical protein